MTEALVLSVVMPVYNEGPNIEPTLEALSQSLKFPYEVLIVYDMDEDTTILVAKSLSPRYPMIRLIKNNVARGPSGAIRTGLKAALAPRILVAMGDLCDDFTQIPQMVSWVPSKADIVCPSRYCEGGAQELDPSLKVWAPKTAGRLLHWLTGLPTYDPTNSYKLYSADFLREISLSSTVSFSVTLEIVTKAHVLRKRILEIPTVWKNRQQGQTSFKLGRSLVTYTPWFCLALLRNRLFAFPPSLFRIFFGSAHA